MAVGWPPGAITVFEQKAGEPPDWPEGLTEIDRRRYGGTEIAIARFGD